MTAQVRYPAHIRSLRANLNGTRKAMRSHAKHCPRCSQARAAGRPEIGCDTGWEWAKDESKFMRALERAGHPELIIDGDQLALW